MEDKKIDPSRLKEGEEGEGVVVVVVAGAQLERKAAAAGVAQRRDQFGEEVGMLQQRPADQAGGHASVGAAEVEIEMAGAGSSGDLGRFDQRGAAVADQLHHQRHASLGADLAQVAVGDALAAVAGDAHELGEDDVGADRVDEVGTHGAVGHPLHRRQHQRRRAGFPGEDGGRGSGHRCSQRERIWPGGRRTR